MKYELNLLEGMVTGKATGKPEPEIVRIKDVFTGMALSHKKYNILRRYFRVHREGLESLLLHLQAHTRTQRKKVLLTLIEGLTTWMDEHLAQYLSLSPDDTDADDPDIDAKKLITSFSLQELGVMVRLYIETGLLRVRNRKALSRFMSEYFVIRTKQVPEKFSADHLYNAIHSPALPAMNSIQKTLNEMLTQLNKLRLENRKREKSKG